MTIEHSPNRLIAIAVLGAGLSVVAYAVGYPRAAAGVLAGAPVSLINYYLVLSAVRRAREMPPARANVLVARRSLYRLALSAGALLLAARFGPEVLIGVLVGVILETLTYFGEAGRLLRPGGGTA